MEASNFSKFVAARFAEIQDALISEHDREVDELRGKAGKASHLQAELSDLQSRSGFADILKSEIDDLRSSRAAEREQSSKEVLALKAQIQSLSKAKEMEERQQSSEEQEAFRAELEELRRAQKSQEAPSGQVEALRDEVAELKRAREAERRRFSEEVEALTRQAAELKQAAERQELELQQSLRTAEALQRSLAEVEADEKKAQAAKEEVRTPPKRDSDEAEVAGGKSAELERPGAAEDYDEVEAVKAEMEALRRAEQRSASEVEALKAKSSGEQSARMEQDQKRDNDRPEEEPAQAPPMDGENDATANAALRPQATRRRGGGFSAARGGAFSAQAKPESPAKVREHAEELKAAETPKAVEQQRESETPAKEEPKPEKVEERREPEEPGEPESLERPFEAEHGFAGAIFGEALRKELGDSGLKDALHRLGQAVPPPPPNAAFRVGQKCEVIGTIMRRDESMESPKVCRLEPGTKIEVQEIGQGPTGKRIKVLAISGLATLGMSGWISVISSEGVALLTPVGEAGAGGFIGDLIGSIAVDEDDLPPSKKSEKVGGGAPAGSIGDILGRLDLQEAGPAEEEPPAPRRPARRSAFDRYQR